MYMYTHTYMCYYLKEEDKAPDDVSCTCGSALLLDILLRVMC